MFGKTNPEAPLQARLAEIEREEKQIKVDSTARLNSLAGEKQKLHFQVKEIRGRNAELARAKMLERLKPIDQQLAELREKQKDFQSRRQHDAAESLIPRAAELHRQRLAILAG